VSVVPTSRQHQTSPQRSLVLTDCLRATMLRRNNDYGDHSVKPNIEDFNEAVGIIGDGVGQEAAIVAQFALDLAVTAQFRMHEIEPAKARQLLRLRIARHRAAQQMSSVAVH